MKSQVKILFCITQGFWGGAQKYVLDLITHLGPDFEVSLAVGQDDMAEFSQKLKTLQIPVYPLKHLKREISPVHDLLAILELKKLYQKIKPDIVHLNSSKAGVLGSLAKIPGIKTVYTAHGWVFLEPLSPLRKWIYMQAEKMTAPKKDAVIVLSKKDKTVGKNILKINENKLYQIPLGIETPSFLSRETAQKKLTSINQKLDPQKTWAFTIANHYSTKGLDILIKAFEELPKESQNQLQLCIIGDGPLRIALQTDINLFHQEKNIVLLPFIANAAQYLKAADFFVLPSRKEGLPYVLLEALEAKLPIIATKVGGVPELLQGTTFSTIIPPEDPSALTQAIQSFLVSKPEKNTKESNIYSLSSMVETTTWLYESLLH